MRKSQSNRSGSDVAALILRLTIGPMMVVHGMNKVRGPGGLEGDHQVVRLPRSGAGGRARPHGGDHRDHHRARCSPSGRRRRSPSPASSG